MESNVNGSRSNGVGGTGNADPQAAAVGRQGAGDGGGDGFARNPWGSVTFEQLTFGDAVSVLERVDEAHRRGEGNGFPINLHLHKSRSWLVDGPPAEDDDVDETRSFPRFVTLLGPQREGGRAVRKIFLCLSCQGLPDDDMERLFRDVLPAHRTLEVIDLAVGKIPTRFLRMLTRAIPDADDPTRATPLSNLSFRGVCDSEQANAIADMLKRNVAVERLEVYGAAEQLNPIVQALSCNMNLRELELYALMLQHGIFDGIAKSSLRRLRICAGEPAIGALSSLASELRTNETMETLELFCHMNDQDRHALLDLAKTYNYKLRVHEPLRELGPVVRQRLDEYERRNARIQDAFAQLQHPDRQLRRKVCKYLLPDMLGLMSDLPTALYRIMKMGYVDKVGRLLAGVDVDDDDDDDKDGHRVVEPNAVRSSAAMRSRISTVDDSDAGA